MPSASYVTLTQPTSDPSNVSATKYYVFNQTGNIMMSTTDSSSKEIEKSVRDVFAEVAVFFAAMTKAISSTPNPSQPGTNYSIYNYAPISSIVSQSGLFVQVSEEDLQYTSSSFGAQFSTELVQAVLGLATGEGELEFASALIATMGQEALNIQKTYSATNNSVGNIIFVCEYLLGMPIVSAILISADAQQNAQALTVSPCFQEQSKATSLYMHKETYLFVTPKFVEKYAGDLDAAERDPAYASLVGSLTSLLARTPTIDGVFDANNKPVTGSLQDGKTYTITGDYLGSSGTLNLVGQAGTFFSVSSWTPEAISFTPTGTSSAAAPIGLVATGAASPFVQTATTFTLASA
jgi:hypothetical protein